MIYDFDEQEDEEDELSSRNGFTGREGERNYDKDPEFADILGSCLDDPQKARSKVSSPSSVNLLCLGAVVICRLEIP